MGWDMPAQTHIPLIHGSDGAKLSKRHGALGVCAYREMGILSEAMCNYLLRLGWSHGDDEIITKEQAIEWFDLEHLGKSPSRFDMKKLEFINAHYLRTMSSDLLVKEVLPLLEKRLGGAIAQDKQERLIRAMEELTKRATNLNELADSAVFLTIDHADLGKYLEMTDKAKKSLEKDGEVAPDLLELLSNQQDWGRDALERSIRDFSEAQSLKMGKVAGVVRVALTHNHVSPSVFDMMQVLGKEESIERIKQISNA